MRNKKKNIVTPPLSNLGWPSATPLNLAEFGAPAVYNQIMQIKRKSHLIGNRKYVISCCLNL